MIEKIYIANSNHYSSIGLKSTPCTCYQLDILREYGIYVENYDNKPEFSKVNVGIGGIDLIENMKDCYGYAFIGTDLFEFMIHGECNENN